MVLYPSTRQHGVTSKKTTSRENLKPYIGICCRASGDQMWASGSVFPESDRMRWDQCNNALTLTTVY
jgi:hypothetical protein